jgi:hypothetical protein
MSVLAFLAISSMQPSAIYIGFFTLSHGELKWIPLPRANIIYNLSMHDYFLNWYLYVFELFFFIFFKMVFA